MTTLARDTSPPAPQPPRAASAPAIDMRPSSLLRYLPALYQDDPFMGRFLRIFEDLHMPMRRLAASMPDYFDPRTSPSELRAALSRWVGAPEMAELPAGVRGRLLARELELHRLRGTKRGLQLALLTATEAERVLVTDATDGMPLGVATSLGDRSTLEPPEPYRVQIRVERPRVELPRSALESLIRQHVPVHVSFELEIDE